MWSQGNVREKIEDLPAEAAGFELDTAIRRVSAAVDRCHDGTPLSDQLVLLIARLLDLVGAGVGSVLLLDADTRMRIAGSVGLSPEIVRATCVELGRGISGTVAAHGEALLVRDVTQDDRFRSRNREHYYSPSFISAPVVCDSAVRGVINVAGKRCGGCFSSHELDLLIEVGVRMAEWINPPGFSEWTLRSAERFAASESD